MMDKKDLYIEKAQATINEQLAKLDQLKAQAEGEVADKKLQLQAQIDKLEPQIEQAKAKLTELKTMTESVLEDTVSKLDDMFDNATDTVKKFFS